LSAVLVTGAAGFIGYHTCQRLLDQGVAVVGVDNLNAYYDVTLKEARLARLQARPGMSFYREDIADLSAMRRIVADHPEIDRIIHLAAQAGVRYSLIDPYAYTHANVTGQLTMLELARGMSNCAHFLYASTSSVYGTNEKMPFSEEDRVDTPISLYAATKKSGELMAHCYSHLFQVPTTGLRFFTVYGPWGRPDMALFMFTQGILAGKPIEVFNGGDMSRDFTYVDDIVSGIVAALALPPATATPYRIYNIGNSKPERLLDYIELLEQCLGRKAIIDPKPMQPGDVRATYADVSKIAHDVGYVPKVSISEGIPRFVEWYRSYYRC
jgi:UDP-glucuronate 4-epimerase